MPGSIWWKARAATGREGSAPLASSLRGHLGPQEGEGVAKREGKRMRAAPASNVSSFFKVLQIPSPPSWCQAKSRSEFAQSIGFDGKGTCTVSASDLLQRRSESFSGTHFLLPRGHLSMRERGGVAMGGEGGPRIDLS